jgi:transcriptional regulator with XRE-family HTH domain
MTKPKRPPKTLDPEVVRTERARLGIPEDGLQQRLWIRYQLQLRGWNQAKVARTAYASESSVSMIYMGQRPAGSKADRVRRLTAGVLGVAEGVLFPEAKEESRRLALDQAALIESKREKATKRKQRQRARARARKKTHVPATGADDDE